MNGLGVYDFIIKDQYDPTTGKTYGALTACNNDDMAARCKVRTAQKVVWCIKANSDFNSTSATSLRAGIKNGSINLLVGDFDAEDIVKNTPGYKSLSSNEQTKLLLPYAQTTLAINEMINLEHEIVNNKVKLKERTGMRKDRYSSLQYNHYVSQTLSNNLRPHSVEQDIVKMLTIRPAKLAGSF